MKSKIATRDKQDGTVFQTRLLKAEPANFLEENRLLKAKIENLHHQIDQLTARLASIHARQGYKVPHETAPIWLQIAPPGSRRKKLLDLVSDGLRCIWHKVYNGSLARRIKPAWPGWPLGKTIQPRTAVKFPDTGVAVPRSEKIGPPRPENSTYFAYSPLAWDLKPTLLADSPSINLVILGCLQRCGSTLLQRMCNARRNTLIWGEHGGVLERFADVYRQIAGFSLAGSAEREEFFGRDEDPNVWTANMCPDLQCVQQAVVDTARIFLDTLYGQYRHSHNIIGFKEVAYRGPAAQLLRRCYPELNMLLLVRNPCDAWKSTPRTWYPNLNEWIELWNSYAVDFLALADRDARCHLIRYEDLIQKEPKTIGILAEVAQLTDGQISCVLAHKIGSNRSGISNAQRRTIVENCRANMERLGYR